MQHSISLPKKLYYSTLIWFTYQTWLTCKVQYCIGWTFLLLDPIWYKMWIFLGCWNVFIRWARYLKLKVEKLPPQWLLVMCQLTFRTLKTANPWTGHPSVHRIWYRCLVRWLDQKGLPYWKIPCIYLCRKRVSLEWTTYCWDLLFKTPIEFYILNMT